MADLEAFKSLPEGNLTKDIFEIIKEEGIEKFEAKVSAGSQHGDNYLGVVFAVDIEGETINGNPKDLHLIVKSSPRGTAMREMMPLSKMYEKEINVYKKYLPEIYQLQNHTDDYEHGKHGFLPTAPLYKASSVVHDEYLVMKNMKHENFIMVSRKVPLPYNHVEFVLRQIGYLHALSVVLRHKKPELFMQLVNELNTNLLDMDENLKKAWGQMITKAVQKAADCYDSVTEKDIYDRVIKFGETAFERLDITSRLSTFIDEPYTVFIHGDCWSNNILYKYDKDNNLIGTCFLDWQISRLASPACELAYFLYNCSGPKDLEGHFEDMIQIYYDSFSEVILEHDLLPEECLPLNILKGDIKKYFDFGLIMAMHTMPLFISDSDEIPEFQNLETFDETEEQKWMYQSKNNDIYIERMRGMISNAISLEIL